MKDVKRKSGTLLVCIECSRREAELNTLLKNGVGGVKPRLCTCKCRIHTEKCKVYRGWPGQNVGITLEKLTILAVPPSEREAV